MEPISDPEAKLLLRGEELAVHAESVLDREVLVARDVVAENVRFETTLLAEEVRITAAPVTKTYADVPPIGEPQRLVVRLSRERAHVAVRVEEYERVSIGARKRTDALHLSASLRHEEIAVERLQGDRP
ncbi:MAG: hypothetical protein NVSMB19_14110 [Vulcanimicrobiaceae bacterium]